MFTVCVGLMLDATMRISNHLPTLVLLNHGTTSKCFYF